MITPLLVVLGAAVGAPVRYLTDRFVRSRQRGVFPWGTFAVNAAGSFLLGYVTAHALPEAVAVLVGTGFCGALTTYSTFGFEAVVLIGQRRYGTAAAYVIGSVTTGLAAATAGAIL